MKLIDILARELDEWPEGYGRVTQDANGRLNKVKNGEYVALVDESYGWFCVTVAEDQSTAIITREQWEEAQRELKAYESLTWTEFGPGIAGSVMSPPVDDPVNSPRHYTHGGVECIDAIEAALTTEEFRGYCKGNVMKYLWRSQHKGDKIQDEKKAQWYLNRLIKNE